MIFGESEIWSILNSTLYEASETKILQLYAKCKSAKFHAEHRYVQTKN